MRRHGGNGHALRQDSPRPPRSLDPLLREWLPRQRWFAGKGRPVTGFSLVAATELLPARLQAVGLYHLLVRARRGPAAR